MLDIEKVLEQYFALDDAHDLEGAEELLKSSIIEASSLHDSSSMITLYNEMIGHYRERSMYEECISTCSNLLHLLHDENLEGTIPYATSLLNVANGCRACGLIKESLTYFTEVQRIYGEEFNPNDYSYAPLYNNMALLFQDMNDFESAVDCLMKALDILSQYADTEIRVAITLSNLAASLLKLNRYEEAIEDIKRALEIFEAKETETGERDYHYGAALSAMGEAMYMAGDLKAAALYYERARDEVLKNTGKSKAYEILQSNIDSIKIKLQSLPDFICEFKNGMDLCKRFYKEYGAKMIHDRFPDYEDQIAVGLVGEGSECFGFDDAVSRDHDFGPGFCLWLTDSLYEEIGDELTKAYEELPRTFLGITRQSTKKAGKRVGVFRISDFYDRLIGLADVPSTENQWLFIEDYQLATATNGEVFRDDLGEFTRIRRGLLSYYPKEVRVKKIAREAANMAQSGQYNYLRMYGRGETVSASLALAEFMKHTMQMVYLLNSSYAPFYKWMHRGMYKLTTLKNVANMLKELSLIPIGSDEIPELIERIVEIIIAEMKKQSLTNSDDTFLDSHTEAILHSLPDKGENSMDTIKSELIDTIVELEWEAFDKVKNEGGRASCQDDFYTFSIMRKSQYMTWNTDMLSSFIEDFRTANNNGWNLITEKYGRMEESTAPDRYATIKDKLPAIDAMKKTIIEEIVKIQVRWMEDFAERYPKAALNARSIHTSEDTMYNTSYETYLRGELSTYSDKTLDLYGRFIAGLLSEDCNLAEMTMVNSARLYGYESLDQLESKL